MSFDDPHRSAEFRERCYECDSGASTACLRCGRPLCVEHRLAEGARCEACEADWKLEAGDRPRPWRDKDAAAAVYWGLAAALCVSVIMVVDGLMRDDIGYAAVGGVAGIGMGFMPGTLVAWLVLRVRHMFQTSETREAVARRRFLEERPDSY